MRYLATIFLSLFTVTSLAQTTYKGRITNRDLRPIPYAIIQVEEQKEVAVYCDADGNFSIEIDNGKAGNFLFYCSGYKTRRLPIQRLNPNSILIKLDEDKAPINNSENNTAKTKQDNIGDNGISNKSLVKKEKTKARIIGDYADEYAVYLKAENSGLLNQISVYVTEYAQPKTEFRLHIYEVGDNKLPGRELTNANIVLHANRGDEWISTDVRKFGIDPGKGVFISVEWVKGRKKNTATPEQTAAIGMTDDYDKLGHITYHRNRFNGAWEKFRKETEGKEQPVNMMVYGTYSYSK